MKKWLIIFGIIYLSICFKEETKKEKTSREEFNKKHTEEITNNKLTFEYSQEKGTHCIAKSDLSPLEYVIHIPERYVICYYDMYPFKFELKEIVSDFMKKQKHELNATKSQTALYAFSFHLMYLSYPKKEAIKEKIKELKLPHYLKETTPEALEYLSSLPKNLHTRYNFEDAEYKLLKKLNPYYDEFFHSGNEIKDVFKYVVDQVKGGKYKHFKVSKNFYILFRKQFYHG
jgi:hypothetical protein